MASPARRVLFAVVAPVQRFFRLEAAGGLVLIGAAVLALAVANSSFGDALEHALQTPLRVGVGARTLSFSFHQLVNDGLMTIFFLVAGMEIKREIVTGELRTLRRAALPLVAAAGGMLVPALIYLAFNHDPAHSHGWAIPTATDIAFALGALTLVKKRVPWSLFVFLTALAIFDDLGAILVIAFAYGSEMHLGSLAVAALLSMALFGLARARVYRPWLYVVFGLALWYFVAASGIHPTIAGVVLGLAVPTHGKRSVDDALEDLDLALESLRQLPAGQAEGSLTAIESHVREIQPPLDRLLHGLHAPVAFGIMPLFALANAGLTFSGGMPLGGPVSSGIFAALVVGKTVGVFGAVLIAVRTRLAPMPSGARWAQVLGVSLLAGIGFTMSLFVSGLAFPDHPEIAMTAKAGVLGGSFVSALAGLLVLRVAGGTTERAREDVSVERIDLPRFAEGYRVTSWQATGPLVGRTLVDAALRAEHGVTVLGVFRDVGVVTADGTRARKLETVDSSYVLTEGDTLLVVGERERIDRFLTDNQPS